MTITELEEAVASRPHSPLFARLAAEYLSIGRSGEAKKLCLAGLELYPEYLSAHLVLARCLHLEGETKTALDHLGYILGVFPDAENVLQLKADWEQTLLNPAPAETTPPPPVNEERLEPGRVEPVRVEPVRVEAVRVEPAGIEPVRVEPERPAVDPDDAEFERRIVSKTLAEIYAQQGAIEDAIITYRLLRKARPDRQEECDLRISELESKRGEKIPAGTFVQPDLKIQ